MAFLDYYLEVYYGENDNIKQMQKCITRLRKDIFKNGIKSKLNSHPEVQKFNRYAEKEFGFKSFQLYIDNSYKGTNAYTLLLDMDLNHLGKETQNNLIITDKGYKYKKEAGYVAFCAIEKGLLTIKNITDREVMAFILHEIGHNFQAAISDYQCMLTIPKVILYTIDCLDVISNIEDNQKFLINLISLPVFWLSDIGAKLYKFIDKIMLGYPELYHMMDIIQSFMLEIKYPIDKVKEYIKIFKNLSKLPKTLMKKLHPLNIIKLFMTGMYREEKVADNFATIYGYGPDLASFMAKYDTGDEVLNNIKIPFLSPILGMIICGMEVLILLPDCHAQQITRIKDQSDYLKQELKKEDLDPKFRNEIMNQIEEIDKTVDHILSLTYEGATKDFTYTNHVYQLLLYKLFGGDPLDIFYKITTDGVHADLERVKKRKLEESSILTKKLNRVILK